ncbi:MAG: UPF0147 family protein [Candidatus Nanoarchaeia archaeon]
MSEAVDELIEYLDEMADDSNIPRAVKSKCVEIKKEISSSAKEDFSLKVNKLLSDLDDLSTDCNIDQYTRQQLWSITSMLEGL